MLRINSRDLKAMIEDLANNDDSVSKKDELDRRVLVLGLVLVYVSQTYVLTIYAPFAAFCLLL